MLLKKLFLMILWLCIFSGKAYAQDAKLDWVKKMGGSNYDGGKAIAIHPDGNIYVAGYFKGTADFDPGPNDFFLSSAGLEDVFICKLDKQGNLIWAKRVGGKFFDDIQAIAVDDEENVYMAGTFEDMADFDPSPNNYFLSTVPRYREDIFILKLDSAGGLWWAKRIGGGNHEEVSGMAVDVSGNVYITGRFEGTADFNPGPDTFNLSSGGIRKDIFISKLDLSGGFLWAKHFGLTGKSEVVKSMAMDSSGNIYITGTFFDTTDFDPGPDTFNLTALGVSYRFISKFDASGKFIDAKKLDVLGEKLALDAFANIYMIGNFHGSMDFDPGPDTFNLKSIGNEEDIFILKLNSKFDFIRANQINLEDGSYNEMSFAVDSIGNVLITINFEHEISVELDTGPLTLHSNGSYDIFICKLNAIGSLEWAKHMGVSGIEMNYCIATDESGAIYSTGYFQNPIDFDPGSNIFTLTSSGATDVFVHKMVTNFSTDTTTNFIPASTHYAVEISVYPNPASNFLNLEANPIILPYTIAITDLSGRQIQSEVITQIHQELSIERLENGIYLYKVTTPTGESLVGKFVKFR